MITISEKEKNAKTAEKTGDSGVQQEKQQVSMPKHEEHKLLAEAKSKELEDTLKRLQAEFENYQKRAAKEYAERMDMGKMEFAKSMLHFADEFENALAHLKGEEKKDEADRRDTSASSQGISHSVVNSQIGSSQRAVEHSTQFENERKGIEMIYNAFKKALSDHGIRQMECAGKKFDPYYHDVVKQEESEKDDGMILSEVKKGYFFREKVLRHAVVVVSKKKMEKENADNEKPEAEKKNGGERK